MVQTKSDAVNDLIARLEAATEGCAELDADIWRFVKPKDYERFYWAGRMLSPENSPEEREHNLGRDRAVKAAPSYTTSLDAAFTLVPEGIYVKFQIDRRHNKAWAWVEMDDVEAIACATPAIALCIAALKARRAAGSPEGA